MTCDAPVLSVLLKAAVAWDVIEQMPCAINLVRVPKPSTGFHDFEAFEALVAAAQPDEQAYLVTLLGGETGLRLGKDPDAQMA